ncbi:MAG: cytidylate kinase family protein [Candidatus Micrarchaeota archaeon]|nr:cytidylate kinase family protein [Candidatus Micrarchaeota archaeon]
MIRICISGLSASGKTSLGHRLAKELNLMHITKASTQIYRKESANFKGDEKLAEMAVSKHARTFDKELIELASKNNCVVTTWLGPWIVKGPTVRVWLHADIDARAKRRAKELNIPVAKAKKMINQKDSLTIKGFKKVQGIDINDRSGFDLELNTERLSVEEMTAIISMLALSRANIKFR